MSYYEWLEDRDIYFTSRGERGWGSDKARRIALALHSLRDGASLTRTDLELIVPSLRQRVTKRPDGRFRPIRGLPRFFLGKSKGVSEKALKAWLKCGLRAMSIKEARGVLKVDLEPLLDTARSLAPLFVNKGIVGIDKFMSAIHRGGPEAIQEEALVAVHTIHTAKGLGAPLVVMDLDYSSKKILKALATQDGLCAERRVAYTGLTRASERLLLVRHPGDMAERLKIRLPRMRARS